MDRGVGSGRRRVDGLRGGNEIVGDSFYDVVSPVRRRETVIWEGQEIGRDKGGQGECKGRYNLINERDDKTRIH